MKKFLIAAIMLLAAAPAHATYYWEHTRNTHTATGKVLFTDPSSPGSIGANNYGRLLDERRADHRDEVECLKDKEVLAVESSNVVVQNSTPVLISGTYQPVAMPSMPVEAMPLTYTVAPTTIPASETLMPGNSTPGVASVTAPTMGYLVAPKYVAVTPTFVPAHVAHVVTYDGAPEHYTGSVSPGYGYATDAEPDTMMPVR